MYLVHATIRLFQTFFSILRKEEMRALLSVMLITLMIGTFGFSLIERVPLFDSFYWSFITLTTIGFGDIHPVTALGKLFTILYATFGLGIMSIFISTLVKYYVHTHDSRHHPH